jgi:tetratricopeptide (TPR) repeat protein
VQVVHVEPKNQRALSNRGVSYRYVRQYDRSVADLTRALELDPNDKLALYHRAEVTTAASHDNATPHALVGLIVAFAYARC